MTSMLRPPERPASGCVRLVVIGDIVGKPGIRMTCSTIPWLRNELKAIGIFANAENAADGSGLRCKDYRRLVESGVDAITLGDHVYRKREIVEVLETQSNIVRPANLPVDAPGKSHMLVQLGDELSVGVICLLGRVFMKPVDCPFHAADRELENLGATKLKLIDFHAEATSDMQLMGRYLDGRVSAVLGTHTHVATADQQILPGGTAFQCDIGMTGPFDGILGRKVEPVMTATLHALPMPFQVATGDVRMNATWIDLDVSTGCCVNVGRLDLQESAINDYNEQSRKARTIL